MNILLSKIPIGVPFNDPGGRTHKGWVKIYVSANRMYYLSLEDGRIHRISISSMVYDKTKYKRI